MFVKYIFLTWMIIFCIDRIIVGFFDIWIDVVAIYYIGEYVYAIFCILFSILGLLIICIYTLTMLKRRKKRTQNDCWCCLHRYLSSIVGYPKKGVNCRFVEKRIEHTSLCVVRYIYSGVFFLIQSGLSCCLS